MLSCHPPWFLLELDHNFSRVSCLPLYGSLLVLQDRSVPVRPPCFLMLQNRRVPQYAEGAQACTCDARGKLVQSTPCMADRVAMWPRGAPTAARFRPDHMQWSGNDVCRPSRTALRDGICCRRVRAWPAQKMSKSHRSEPSSARAGSAGIPKRYAERWVIPASE